MKKKIPKSKCYSEEERTCEKEIKVYFCPKCNSYNVRYVFGMRNLLGILPKMKCFDCNFEASVFPLLVTTKGKIKKAKKKLKGKKKR